MKINWKSPLHQSENVPLPEYGEGAYTIVRKMTVADQARFYSAIQFLKEKYGEEIPIIEFRLCKIACCSVDDDGNYTIELEEVSELAKTMPGDAFSRLHDMCEKLNPPIQPDDVTEKKS